MTLKEQVALAIFAALLLIVGYLVRMA